jgi:hypothetical protein
VNKDRNIGASDEDVEAIASIIRAAPTMDAANAELRAYGLAFEETPEWQRFPTAFGGYSAELGRVVLNPRKWPERRRIPWETVISHELVHTDQMNRASARGASPQDIVKRKLAYIAPNDAMDYDRYLSDPLELQALARNAVDAAEPGSVAQRLRQGQLARLSPLLPRDPKRFAKYAYEIARARGKLGENRAKDVLRKLVPHFVVELEKAYVLRNGSEITIRGEFIVPAANSTVAVEQVEAMISRQRRGIAGLLSTDPRITWSDAAQAGRILAGGGRYVDFSFQTTGRAYALRSAK